MHDDLCDRVGAVAGRTTAPTAAIIDSQSVKGSEMIGRASRGYDAGKKITRRSGTSASMSLTCCSRCSPPPRVQECHAAQPLLWNLRRAFPSIKLAWADGGYAGKLVTWAKTSLRLTLQIVRRPDDLHTPTGAAPRWVVERTLSWITHHPGTVRDYERLPAHHETYVYWAVIIIMTRRLAHSSATTLVSRHATFALARCGCSPL